VALGLLLVCWQTKRTSGARAPASVLGTPQRTRGAWVVLRVSHARNSLEDT